MRIIRDYQCNLCDAVEEHFALSERAIETDVRVHHDCPYRQRGLLRAVLSPTATTFKFADGSATKRRRVHP